LAKRLLNGLTTCTYKYPPIKKNKIKKMEERERERLKNEVKEVMEVGRA
jgi:hypothetical protein